MTEETGTTSITPTDADAGGEPTLRIAQMVWSDDGWPISGGP